MTDAELLDTLLEHQDHIATADCKSFIDMRSRMARTQQGLTDRQRNWVMYELRRVSSEVGEDLIEEDQSPANLFSGGKIKPAGFAPLDSIPKPLKPPGRC